MGQPVKWITVCKPKKSHINYCHGQPADAHSTALLVADANIPNVGSAANVDGGATTIDPSLAHRTKVVGIDFQTYGPLFGGVGQDHERGRTTQRLGQHHGSSTMQNTEGLVGSGINGHSSFEVAIAGFGKFNPQVFYNRVGVCGVDIFDINASFHNAVGFTYFCTKIGENCDKIIHLEHKRIYIIRHGETDYNRRGVVQGSGVDADLNDMGRAQADAFFQAYQHVPFDKVYISSLKRTLQTVQPFIDLGLPYERHAGLNEISWGVMEGKIPGNIDDEYYRDLTEGWASGDTARTAEGGESPEQVRDRQKPVIDLILSRPDETTVLVAMHGRALRILLTWLMDEPLADMDEYEHSNLCLYQLNYNYDTQQFTIELANDTAHLMAVAVSSEQ